MIRKTVIISEGHLDNFSKILLFILLFLSRNNKITSAPATSVAALGDFGDNYSFRVQNKIMWCRSALLIKLDIFY